MAITFRNSTDMIPAQVRASSLAVLVSDIGQDCVHIGYESRPGVYTKSALDHISEARAALCFIEAAIMGGDSGQ